MIHLAPIGFVILKWRSTGCKSLTAIPCSNCANIWFEYYSWNSCLRKSLAGLFVLTSRGWSRSVQFGGIWTKRILFCRKMLSYFPFKLIRATWSSGFLISLFKGPLKWYFHLLFYCINIYIISSNAQKHLFDNSIMCVLQDIKPQSTAYVITANFVT